LKMAKKQRSRFVLSVLGDVNSFNRNSGPVQRRTTFPAVSLGNGNIGPSTEEPHDQRTKLYQGLVGLLAYILTNIQPDVAQSHS
jgi:hypothetical protein